MYVMGLMIESPTALFLVTSTGLAVDYSSHIMHSFITAADENQCNGERVKVALVQMGPPVFSGGFSTFLAFIFLANSTNHMCNIFVKVYFLVVVFGLYNGLVLLPTILSLVGPKPTKLDH